MQHATISDPNMAACTPRPQAHERGRVTLPYNSTSVIILEFSVILSRQKGKFANKEIKIRMPYGIDRNTRGKLDFIQPGKPTQNSFIEIGILE